MDVYIYMDRIVKKVSLVAEYKNGDCTVLRLLFADNLAPLESTQNDLRQVLIDFRMHAILPE